MSDAPKSPLDRARVEKAAVEAAASAAASAAADAATRAGHGVLDAIETLLFGKVGGAEEAIRAEEGVDPLARLRADAAKADALRAEVQAADPAPPREDPEAVARRQLEALKAARGAPPATEDPPKRRL